MRTRLRRHRAGIVVTVAALLAVAVTALLAGTARTADPLDPANPDPAGARALARVLADRGVEVRVARGADAFEDAAVDADTTVVVTGTQALGPATIDRMLAHAGEGELLLVEPDFLLVESLGVDAEPRSAAPDGPIGADCTEPAVAELRLDVTATTAYDAPGCFTTSTGHAVLVRAEATRGAVRLWGAGEALANDGILHGDNAAIALRLLGGHDRLVWYVPDPADLDGSAGVGLGSLLPRWIGPGLWLALVTVVALAWWRGRRLGPLAREPLPVVVRAAETTESLGRLYRRAGDRDHAADVLRRASLDRLAGLLRLGTGAGLAQVTRAAADRTGRPLDDVTRLLSPAVPDDDRALIALANDLADLEEEVRHP